MAGERRNDIDFLRVLGTCFVFLFHTLQPFNPNENWHITNAERSDVAGYLIWFMNLWIMQLFMLLAGSSAWFSMQRRSSGQFVRERIQRIAIPLVAGIFLFVAPQVYLERLTRDQFHGSLFKFYPHFFDGIYPKGNFSWHHLWFLAYLLTYSMISIPLLRLKFDNVWKWVRSPYWLLALSLPLMLGSVLLSKQFPTTNSLVNDWMWHSQLWFCFLYGAVLVSNPRAPQLLESFWRRAFALAVPLTLVLLVLRALPPTNFEDVLYVLRRVIRAMTTTCWLITFLGAGRRYLDRRSPLLDRASEASYPFYILHQFLIVAVSFLVVQTSFSLHLKWGLVFTVAFILTCSLYWILRLWAPTRVIVGMKAGFKWKPLTYSHVKLMLLTILMFLTCEKGLATTMKKISLSDKGVPFDVTVFEADSPNCAVLFAVGSGGNPERHIPLLLSLAKNGCTVVAPHFERLASPMPTQEELLLRARRLHLSLDFVMRANLRAVGVGHSIGATTLLALAGGQIWMGPGQPVPIKADARFEKLVLMTPPTGFFQAPGALDDIRTPVQVWAGTSDPITPPAQAEFLKSKLQDQVSVDLRIIEGAGHFSFVNTLPPQTTDPLPDREKFLADLADEIRRYINKN